VTPPAYTAWRRPVGGAWRALGTAPTEAGAWQQAYAAMTEPNGHYETCVLPAGEKPRGRIERQPARTS